VSVFHSNDRQSQPLEVAGATNLPTIVGQLDELLELGVRFATVYADPPWRYDNTAARGAAAKHYSTMSIDALCDLPVSALVAENAHLHLWTTNGLLPDAFRVVEAWGFRYKSCLVWIKPQLGMGNYWRVSHEYLLFGIRGKLPFRDNSQRSWIKSRRRRHSAKPYAVRELVERVSPGPYLELFGREEIPFSQWTVFGNEVERRLF
jgi:N6-adenosine-specific RNA methylase IME4